MYRLLVIKPSSLGDIVHGLQVLQTAAAARPDLRITWVVRERFADLVNAAPFVHERIIFRRRDGLPGFLRVLRELRTHHFDAVWDMQGLLRSGIMTAAARAPLKIGRPDAREGAGFFYHRRVSAPAGEGPFHALDVLLPFLRELKVAPDLRFPLAIETGGPAPWRSFFTVAPEKTFVVFNDSRGPKKTWPHFVPLMRAILEQIPDSQVVWCAARPAPDPFAAPPGRFLNLTGCPLNEMIALVQQPSVFVGNDTGPMHLAAASGNRVLAIFGPTSPQRFGPYPSNSSRHRAVCAPGGDLKALAPATVLEALREPASRREGTPRSSTAVS